MHASTVHPIATCPYSAGAIAPYLRALSLDDIDVQVECDWSQVGLRGAAAAAACQAAGGLSHLRCTPQHEQC